MRTTLVLCCLALGAVPAHSQIGLAQAAPFAVYTHFDNQPSKPVLDSLKAELTSIMLPVGFPYEWKSLDAPRQGESFSELAVVTFKGTCDLSGLLPQRLDTGALGWTHVTDGHIIPFSDVDCDRIRGFLSRALVSLPQPQRDYAFGRAVARVMAHELYHIFSHMEHHGPSGVAQPSYNVRELMGDDFRFSADDREILSALLVTSQGRQPKTAARMGQSLYDLSGCIRCHGAQGEGTGHGPALRVNSQPLNAEQLAVRLDEKTSEMFKRARSRKMLWPALPKTDIDSLVNYLNSSSESSVSAPPPPPVADIPFGR
jgi:mono/diheme cytochrome c family protein